MSGYTKLFGSILESTVWLESPPVKVVWITLLAMADRDGVAEASVPGLAKRAGVDRAHCEQALAVFLAPDPDSRTKAFDGRRIEEVPGGWRILNHSVYRERATKEEAREKAAARQRLKRERDAAKSRMSREVTNVTQSNDIAEAPPPPPPPSYSSPEKKQPLPTNGRSKHPVYTSDRFAVFEWQFDELSKMLGGHFEAFDIHGFFDALTQQSRADGLVIPKADVWAWLQAEVLAEAKRRKLPMASTAPPKRDKAAEEQAQNDRVMAKILQDREERARYAGR